MNIFLVNIIFLQYLEIIPKSFDFSFSGIISKSYLHASWSILIFYFSSAAFIMANLFRSCSYLILSASFRAFSSSCLFTSSFSFFCFFSCFSLFSFLDKVLFCDSVLFFFYFYTPLQSKSTYSILLEFLDLCLLFSLFRLDLVFQVELLAFQV